MRLTEGEWLDLTAVLLAEPLNTVPQERLAIHLAATFDAPGCAFGQADSEGVVSGGMSGVRPLTALRGCGAQFRFFWWGMHLELDHETLEIVLNSADTVNTLVELAGGEIPSPAQPYIKVIAEFIRRASAELREMDRGYGVYFSMSWFAPGVIVPTPVLGLDSRSRSRESTLLYSLTATVPRLAGDVDTGLVIETGQRIVANASSSVWSGIIFTFPNGPAGWPDWQAGAEAPLPGVSPFGLLARLDASLLYVGVQKSWVHLGRPAKLYFLINDHRKIGKGGVHRQRGRLLVLTTTQSRPPCPRAALSRAAPTARRPDPPVPLGPLRGLRLRLPGARAT